MDEHATANELPEERESLWWIALSPTIWAVHFLACYLTAAIWCARFAPRDGGTGGSLTWVRWAILAYTVAAVAGIVATGWIGYRRHRHGTATVPHDFDTPEDRHRFLGFATLLLSALSLVGTLFVASVALYFETCR